MSFRGLVSVNWRVRSSTIRVSILSERNCPRGSSSFRPRSIAISLWSARQPTASKIPKTPWLQERESESSGLPRNSPVSAYHCSNAGWLSMVDRGPLYGDLMRYQIWDEENTHRWLPFSLVPMRRVGTRERVVNKCFHLTEDWWWYN